MLVETLRSNPKLIINTDIDGILSGLLLHHYLGCEIVGFSNSWDYVWVDKSRLRSYKEGTYIDLYVADPEVISIEQHIIAVDNEHLDILKNYPTKINPNLERGRIFTNSKSYSLKYPFGTFHYLCALLEREGVKIDLDLDRSLDGFKLGDFITRADDALFNSHNQYQENAWDWWRWLKARSSNGSMTNQIIDYVKRYNTISSEQNKKRIDSFCSSAPYYSGKKDGEYKEILAQDGTLLTSFQSFIHFLARISRMKYFPLSSVFTTYSGKAQRIIYYRDFNDEFIHKQKYRGEPVFSYSFIYGPFSRYSNFSYTLEIDEE